MWEAKWGGLLFSAWEVLREASRRRRFYHSTQPYITIYTTELCSEKCVCGGGDKLYRLLYMVPLSKVGACPPPLSRHHYDTVREDEPNIKGSNRALAYNRVNNAGHSAICIQQERHTEQRRQMQQQLQLQQEPANRSTIVRGPTATTRAQPTYQQQL